MERVQRHQNSNLKPIPNRRYFSISDAAHLCGVKPHVLRYWEQEFQQLKPKKRRGNRRYYQRRDLLIIRHIRELLYDQGYTIVGARQQLTALKLDEIVKVQEQKHDQPLQGLVKYRDKITTSSSSAIQNLQEKVSKPSTEIKDNKLSPVYPESLKKTINPGSDGSTKKIIQQTIDELETLLSHLQNRIVTRS